MNETCGSRIIQFRVSRQKNNIMAQVISNIFAAAAASSSGNLLAGEPKESAVQRPIISLQEVLWHDHAQDCWIVVYDRVYDVTDFLDEHPGGDDILLEHAGRDATIAFRGTGHSAQAIRALDKYCIGELPMEERLFRNPSGLRLSDIPP